MSMRLIFWLLLFLWLVFGVIPTFPKDGVYWAFGGSILHFVLFVLLGWKVYGPPISE